MQLSKNVFTSPSGVRRQSLYYFLCLIVVMMFSFSTELKAQCTQLVWFDEFDTPSLDQTKWSYVLGRGCDTPAGCGFGNGEEQSYTNNPNNVSVSGGFLNITAIPNNPEPGAAFSSGKIQTLGIKSFKYGKIEAKIKLPSGTGAWPAFWMLPVTNNWPYTGEIDIMEAKHRNPTQVLGTVFHYNGHNTGQLTTPDLSLAFHTYAVEWEMNEIRWYFDGALYHRANPSTTGGAWPFNDNNPFYVILNLAIGGLGSPFTGNIAFNAADFPQTMQVDYVRVYTGKWNVEFLGDPFVYKNESNKTYSVTPVAGATYSWSVPAGATIASGQGTSQINVNFGSGAVSGNITAAITSGCATQNYTKAVTVEAAFKVTTQLKDWDANNNMTLKSASGTLTQVVNPSGTGNVGKYIRNSGQLYDNLVYNNIAFGNASDFVTRRRRIHADIYTDAPVGTKLRIQLENSVKSAQTFPVGRHSVHEVKTTKQNQWETVEFEYVNSPDLGTGSFTVDQIAFLLAVETNNGSTYYIDNVQIGTAGDLCPRVLNQTLEDFQTNRNITFNSSTGTLTSVANPSPTGVNTSAQVGKYIRNSAELYDVLFYKNVAINNVANFKNGKSVFKMAVNSNAPVGTAISLQLETSASTPSNYPTGRHSLYQGVTSVQNQWEIIEFSYITALDALAADADVNSLVFLFNPNSSTNSTYYFDNLLTEAENCSVITDTEAPTVPTGLTSPTKTNNSVNLTWTASTDNVGVTGYEVYVGTETTPRTTVTSNSATIGSLSGGTPYTFKVRAKDAVPNFSGYSTSITVTTNANPVGLPSPWVTSDIGATGVAGTASYSAPTFTAQGSGADIWGAADAFRFVSQTVTGDVTITARVASLGNTDGWAKAGVMVRETTAAGSTHAFTGVTASNGLAFQRRLTTGGQSEHTAGPAGTAPYWVRLTRVGNVISSFVSTTGTTWTQVGAAVTITMTSSVQVGLAVTSHNNTVLSTATFDNVTVTTGNVAVTGVTVSPTAASINIGTTQQLMATVAPSNATNKNVAWSSGNTAIATVSSTGLVSAVAAGTATITVTTQDGAKTATSTITVTTSPILVTGVTVSPTSASIVVGATQLLTATVAPANATNKNVTWTTSNSGIATVSTSGLATGVAAGSATITVTTQDGAKTATSTITVTAPPTGVDITNLTGGVMSAQYDDSPAAERFPNLIDNNVNTKYLTIHASAWVQFQAPASYVVNRYTITSANDAAERDPLNWTLQGSTSGTTWVTIDTRSAEDFPSRFQTRSFTFTNTTGYAYYRFNLTNNSGTMLQLAEFELFGTAVSNGVCTGNGPIASGQTVPDYKYEISTSGNVNVKFIPGTPIAGCDLVLFYYRIGTGGYSGFTTAAASGAFTTSVSIPTGSAIQFYFTYRRSAGGMESNSSATPHSYTIGTTCAGARSVEFEESVEESYVLHPNPVEHTLTIKGSAGGRLGIINMQGVEVSNDVMVTDDKDVSNLSSGIYNVILIKNNKRVMKRFVKK
jgi:uncharacterized protein YjdB/beta-glucanase (GH16 family)